MIIISKGYNDTQFDTPKGSVLIRGRGVINNINDELWEYVVKNWESYIKKMTFDEKTNPSGCYVWNNKKQYAFDKSNDMFKNGVKSKDSPFSKEEMLKKDFGSMNLKDLRAYAKENNIQFSYDSSKTQLIDLIVKEESK